jgi:hypothetical protein
MTTTVSQAYLDGILEGRDFKRHCIAAGDTIDAEFMRAHLATIERTMRGFSGTMRDFMRGERDFWRNQLNKGA